MIPTNSGKASEAVSDAREFPTLREANEARQREWCPEQLPDLSFRGNELAGETGEVCNVIKKLERERLGWRGSRDTAEHLAEELADVVICADLCALSVGIDLNAAVEAKFNATSEKVDLPHRLRSRRAADAPAREVSEAEVEAAALRDVAAERRRQVEVEGWSAEHDDEHQRGEMARAAGCYALADVLPMAEIDGPGTYVLPAFWPWDGEWWKPGDRRRDLVKAAALILAEIERLDRAAGEKK